MKRLIAVASMISTVACGGSNSSSGLPTAATPVAATRVISISGDLDFGQMIVGDVQTKIITIINSGTSTLTISGITGPCASFIAASWVSGTISSGASQTVSVRFAPTSAQICTGVVTINGDQTSGTNTIALNAKIVAGYSRDLTGRWRGTVGADTIITLTETAGTLSGTFDSLNLKGSVSGSVSNTGAVTMTVTVPGFQSFTLSGQADDAGNAISGQVNGSGFQNNAFTLNRI